MDPMGMDSYYFLIGLQFQSNPNFPPWVETAHSTPRRIVVGFSTEATKPKAHWWSLLIPNVQHRGVATEAAYTRFATVLATSAPCLKQESRVLRVLSQFLPSACRTKLDGNGSIPNRIQPVDFYLAYVDVSWLLYTFARRLSITNQLTNVWGEIFWVSSGFFTVTQSRKLAWLPCQPRIVSGENPQDPNIWKAHVPLVSGVDKLILGGRVPVIKRVVACNNHINDAAVSMIFSLHQYLPSGTLWQFNIAIGKSLLFVENGKCRMKLAMAFIASCSAVQLPEVLDRKKDNTWQRTVTNTL